MNTVKRTLPWFLATLALASGTVGGIWMVQNSSHAPGLLVPHVFLIPGYAVVGAIIASRRRTHPAGWLLLAVSLLSGVTTLTFSYAAAVFVAKTAAFPGAVYAAWVENWMFPLDFVVFGWVVLVFPTGALPSRRWRPFAMAMVVAWGLFILMGTGGTPMELGDAKIANPFASGPLTSLYRLYPIFVLPAFASLLACAAAPFFRLRRASPVEREQLRWLAYACGFTVIAALVAALFAMLKVEPLVAVSGVVVLAAIALGIPAAVGVAILRYHLFDIDRIISRTVSYGLVTVLLGGTFAAVVLVPTAVIGSGRTPGWLVAAATLIAFGLFRPVVRRVRSVIDRRFNRSRYDAARTIEAFSARLREEVDIVALEAELRDVVNGTMQPEHVLVWLRR